MLKELTTHVHTRPDSMFPNGEYFHLPFFLSSAAENLLNNLAGLSGLFLTFYAVSLNVWCLCVCVGTHFFVP